MGDMISTFLKDRIIVNGKEYGRKDYRQIAADNNCQIRRHPFNTSMTTFTIETKTIINEDIECRHVIFNQTDQIMEVIMYPYSTAPLIAACSTKAKPDIYSTPLGTMCDYRYDNTHKISMGPDHSVIYIWD